MGFNSRDRNHEVWIRSRAREVKRLEAEGRALHLIVCGAKGFNDKSFNQIGYKGLVDAKKALKIKTGQVESNAESEYADNINAMVQQKCDHIVTVGFLLSDDTLAAAKKNKDIKFAIVDNNDPKTYPAATNLKPLVFNTAESSFMAGYLAAGMSKTKKVGTFGGAKIPTVTIFMDGYADGVKYYNEQKGKDVKLLGWNKEAQDGSFTGDFEKQDVGKQLTQNFLDQGADIVMPVAGPVGKGAGSALKEAKAAGKDVKRVLDRGPNPYKQTLLHSVFLYDSLTTGAPTGDWSSLKGCKEKFETQVNITNITTD